MTMKARMLCFFNVLTLYLLMATPVFAQTNLFTNPSFEQSGGFQTDYSRVYDHHGVDHGQYAIDYNTEGYGIGNWGWPEVNGHGGSGRFMMVNGFSGSDNPNKVVWRQTVTVTQNTDYTFSCYVANLNQVVYGQINPAKLQLKINGQNVGGQYELPTDNNWHAWPNLPVWNSGNATQAIVEIHDNYIGLHGLGDDFAIDDLSFIGQSYTVTTNDDQISACLSSPVICDVLSNDVIYPDMQGMTLTIITLPSHGEATRLYNNTIEYVFNDPTYSGTTDQFRYRVTSHGVTGEAWVHVTLSRPPVVANITAPQAICAGGSLGINAPSVTPFATGQWQKCQTSTGTNWTSFDPTNIPLSMNGWWVRYSATNDCGTGTSNAVQITVTNGPSFTGQTPQIQPICAGTSLTLTPPSFSANGSQILSQDWVASPTSTGEYSPFNPNNIPATYNGWYIRYRIEGSCGYVYSDPARLLTVNVAPDVTGTLEAPEAICTGGDLNVTPPSYEGNGTGDWEICQNANGTYQSFSIQNVPATYNNWYLHYKVSNDCGYDVSNAVQIHVNDAPTISTPAAPQAICAGNSFNLTTPTIQNHGSAIIDQGWQIAAQQNGNYNAFNNNNVSYANNGYWIRYFAENECGLTYSASVQITVNDEPVVGSVTAPVGICAGQSFNLTVPQIDWRHTNQGTGSWEIAPTSSGEFSTLNNNNIPFSYNGYYIRYKAVNGCGTSYSTNVVQVTVYSTEPTYDTITACDTYVWNGVICDHSGNYQAQVQNPNDCTITAYLHFIMSDAYTETQTFSACGSFTWPVNGHTYYASCIDTDTIESGNYMICDSIFTLSLTINNAPEILGDIIAPTNVCAGSSINMDAPQYVMNHVEGGDAHWEYAISANGPFMSFDPSANNLSFGTYYLRYAVINACDEAYSNVVTFHVDDVPEALMQLSGQQVCEGQMFDLPETNVNWNNENVNDRLGEWQISPSQYGTYVTIETTMVMQMSHNGYWLRFRAHNSCGDDIVGPVQITVNSSADQWLETITTCDSYQLESGEIITESQMVEYEVYEPCFHIVHQPVVINHSDYVVEAITSCHEEEVWHGRTFYYSEQMQYAWDTLTNMYNCDSVVELNLNFDEYSSYTHIRTACDSYVWEMNPNVVYTESVRDSVFVPAVGPNDCDTWYFLELTLGHHSVIDGGMMEECSGFVWHGVPYFEDAIIYDSLQTPVTHCDSVITYQLSIIPPIENDTNIMSCHPVMWQEHYCEEEGDYQHVFQSMQGCDSIVTMHFSLTPEIVMPPKDTLVCEPFVWYGHFFNGDDQSSHIFLTPQGCDSTVFLNVTFVQTDTLPDSFMACNAYTFHGVTYEPGNYEIYHDTVFLPNGCIREIQLLNLTVKDSEQLGAISGPSNVYVASSMIGGIYRYEIDMEGLYGPVTWSLSNSDWQIIEQGNDFCRVLVTTPATAYLTVHFNVEDCGEMEHTFEIVAGFFGVDDIQNEVRIFPNPTQGTVTIETEGIECLRLTNMMGQVLEMHEYNRSDNVVLNLSGYTPSVYLLEIKTVNGMVKKRLVLCR